MQNLSFSETDGVLCFDLNLPGGIVLWEEWLSENIALMPVLHEKKKAEASFISFTSGHILFQEPIQSDCLERLSKKPGYCIFPHNLGEDLMWEGLIYKPEYVDITGKAFEGIRNALKGSFEDALLNYEQALNQNPLISRVNNLKGLSLRFLEQYEGAERAYNREIEINQTLPDPYGNLGILHLKNNCDNLARSLFERALERDPFHLNSLLHFGRVILKLEEPTSRLLSSVNFRLSALFSEITAVQEHLLGSAQKCGLTFPDYILKIRAEAGLLSDPELLKILRRMELFRLNGAIFAALRGYAHILAGFSSNPAVKNFLESFIAKRLYSMESNLPDFIQRKFDVLKGQLFAPYPGIIKLSSSYSGEPVFPQTRMEGPLTPIEFLQIFLEEILRDGKISKSERKIIDRLKNSFGIEEKNMERLFSKVRSILAASASCDALCDADPEKLIQRITAAVSRDGKIESTEKKLLGLAREILGLPNSVTKE
ncbi:MAG: hypothetical protein HQM08_07315 [Candidatus Riflebacteria bacterium]|nr:hypothetical protein [Candidatus Riflebacteria bacterium]